MATKFWYIEFKYPGNHWELYDQTQVQGWAELQVQRMVREHPGAEYRQRRA